MKRTKTEEMKTKEYLEDQGYTEEDQGEGYILNVSEMIDLLNGFSEHKNKELSESLKEEQARIVLLSNGYNDLEKQNKRYLNVLKISLESVLESINSKNQ